MKSKWKNRLKLIRKEGYRLGWSHGIHLGNCEAIIQKMPKKEGPTWDIRVLFVSTDKKEPYLSLDKAVFDGLNEIVREVCIASTSENVVSLVQEIRPDLVLVLSGFWFPLEQVDAIRTMGVKTAVWFTDDPFYTDITINIAPRYDFVFTLELSCISFYQQLGCQQVHYLPLAVTPNAFYPKRVDLSYRKEICFIGSAFWYRVSYFDRIAKYLSGKDVFISGYWWERLQHYFVLRKKIQLGNWMPPEQTSSYYNGAKIVINLHRHYNDESFNMNSRKIPALSVNPRTFEISNCGTLQLTDVRHDLHHFYTPGHDIVTYSSPEELVEKIDYYLNNEDKRRQIALRALCRTMNEHTYRSRLSQLLSIIFG
jgi:spore maturation protein CgeB